MVPRYHWNFSCFSFSACINIFGIAYVCESEDTNFELVVCISFVSSISSCSLLCLLGKRLTFSNLIVRKTSVWEPMKRSFSGDILAGKKALRLLFCPASKKSDRIYGSFGKCCACLFYCSIIVLECTVVQHCQWLWQSNSVSTFKDLKIQSCSNFLLRTNPIWKMPLPDIDFPKCQDTIALKMRPCFVRVAASSSRPIDSAKKGKSFQ